MPCPCVCTLSHVSLTRAPENRKMNRSKHQYSTTEACYRVVQIGQESQETTITTEHELDESPVTTRRGRRYGPKRKWRWCGYAQRRPLSRQHSPHTSHQGAVAGALGIGKKGLNKHYILPGAELSSVQYGTESVHAGMQSREILITVSVNEKKKNGSGSTGRVTYRIHGRLGRS